MSFSPALIQLTRIFGREALVGAIGADPARFVALDEEQRAAIEALVRERADAFVEALAAEAAASDDVADVASALDYGERRLQEFAPLLGAALRSTLLARFRSHVDGWASPPAG